jgi:uncharacterized protein
MFKSYNKKLNVTGIVALHDVSPHWEAEIDLAMKILIDEFNLRPALFVIPNYHHVCPFDGNKQFIAGLNSWSAMGCELILHGYCHQVETEIPIRNLSRHLRSKLLTANEGEFLNLTPAEIVHRLDIGIEMFRTLQLSPVGFVAPAWLYNRHLAPALIQRKLAFHEGHFNIYNLQTNKTLFMPAISFCARDKYRARLSTSYGRFASLMMRTSLPGKFRLALHPVDFQCAELVEVIRELLFAGRKHIQWRSYSETLQLKK